MARGATTEELAKRISQSLRFTEYILHDFRDRGIVVHDGGLWFLTTDGARYGRALRNAFGDEPIHPRNLGISHPADDE